jgi:hypothetical protein
MSKKNQPESVPDLSSVAGIKATFEQLRPPIKAADKNGFVEAPTPEEYEKIKAFAGFIRAAIPVVLGTNPADAPRAFSSWSAEQRALLEEIARVPEDAHINSGQLSATLTRLGAIDIAPRGDDRYLFRYAGLAKPSVLEAEVDSRPLWLTLRLCLMGKLDLSEWRKSVADLDGAMRVDFAKRATSNAYQLMHRWPLPVDLTTEIELEDATQLYNLLLPMLDPLSAEERKTAILSEEAESFPNFELVLLLSVGQATAQEPITAKPESLTSALTLFTNTTIGTRFLSALPPDKRRELIKGIELMPHNLDGWAYLDLLDPGDRHRAVIETLASFKRAARSDVAAHFSKLIQTFDDVARAELRKLAEKGGPNAKAIETALNKQS